jgi:hypothetical protein
MKKTARLLVTERCPRKCSYCCNKLPGGITGATYVRAEEFSANGFDELVISGGEPMLVPKLVRKIVNRCKLPTYLYTALYNAECRDGLREGLFAGISYTLHEKFSITDYDKFYNLQDNLAQPRIAKRTSARLKIHPSVHVQVWEHVWSRVDRRPFKEDICPLPEHETLFILTE